MSISPLYYTRPHQNALKIAYYVIKVPNIISMQISSGIILSLYSLIACRKIHRANCRQTHARHAVIRSVLERRKGNVPWINLFRFGRRNGSTSPGRQTRDFIFSAMKCAHFQPVCLPPPTLAWSGSSKVAPERTHMPDTSYPGASCLQPVNPTVAKSRPLSCWVERQWPGIRPQGATLVTGYSLFHPWWEMRTMCPAVHRALVLRNLTIWSSRHIHTLFSFDTDSSGRWRLPEPPKRLPVMSSLLSFLSICFGLKLNFPRGARDNTLLRDHVLSVIQSPEWHTCVHSFIDALLQCD